MIFQMQRSRPEGRLPVEVDVGGTRSEVDQSAGADIVEVVGAEASNVVALAEMTVLDPYRHRGSVDFLDNTQTPDLDIGFGANDDVRIVRKPSEHRTSIKNDALLFSALRYSP